MSQHDDPPPSSPPTPRSKPTGQTSITSSPWFRVGAVVAVALVVALIAYLAQRGGDDSSTGTTPSSTTTTPAPPLLGPVTMSQSGIVTLGTQLGLKLYWLGAQPNKTYEVTENANQSVQIRYLPVGVPAGANPGPYDLVVTYPDPGAYAALQSYAAAETPPHTSFPVPGGGLGLVYESYPVSVHVAYPGGDVQLELYTADPTRSAQLAQQGALKPVS